MQILPYDPKVDVIWSTPKPAGVVGLACSTTQKGIYACGVNTSPELIQFLYSAEHGNPLEHAVICLDITQISRACADQLRTHRTCSPTMSSTHYQHHGDHPHRVPYELSYQSTNNFAGVVAAESIELAMQRYNDILERGYHKEDARQILPLSIEVRYMLTINARSLAHLIRLRSCYRNTIETILCTERILNVARQWFYDLFEHVGKPCDLKEGCHEGKMKCKYSEVYERLLQYD